MSRLWIDSNCARSVKELRALSRLARKKGIFVSIHPQVYLERRRQIRESCAKDGKIFDVVLFDEFLKDERIEVPPFLLDQAVASHWSDELSRRYPAIGAWEKAKKNCIGGELKKGFEALPGDMPMTTDWLIALQVEGDPVSRIVTEDSGEEWRALREQNRVFSWVEAMGWLESLPKDGASPTI